MKTTDPPPFRIESLDHLRRELERLGPAIPLDDNLTPLSRPLDVGTRTAPNRFCVLPMEGRDAGPDGAPGPLTVRRYTAYARGGAGLIWMESTAVSEHGRAGPAQLWLHAGNVDAFAAFVDAVRNAARERFQRDLLIVLQLAHTDGRCTDTYLDTLADTYVGAARLARQAGFDGVDVKSCHNALGAGLLAATERPGTYGGAFANRTRFLREVLTRTRGAVPDLLLTTRLSVCHPVYHSHGIAADEAHELVRVLVDMGLDMLSVSAADSYTDPRFTPGRGEGAEEQSPFAGLAHAITITRNLQQAFPRLPVVGSGFTRLGEALPSAAAGVIGTHSASFAGIGRCALANPDLPADILEHGEPDPARYCISCGACSVLVRDGVATGCVIRDQETYGPGYRHQRRFSRERLVDEARRCHDCEHAPCSAACPTRIDVPAFVKAFAGDDIARSYNVLRQSNVLPEMCSHLCPTWMLCEGACVETVLSGNPIPIADIQYAVCWIAREGGHPGVELPDTESGRSVAIVGGGPAGVACAVKLLERGHRVVIIERDDALGGAPRSLIPSRRLPDPLPEIDAVLAPSLAAGRLELRFGRDVGRELSPDTLRHAHDAVLLAAGLWQERSLGTADGVVDAIRFLRETKDGTRTTVPDSVAVLAGDDCAMDAAVTARSLGAVNLYVVYAGPRSAMHWHRAEDWFKTAGVHCCTLTKPLGYEIDARGRLTDLRIARTRPVQAAEPDDTAWETIPGTESLLRVGLVVEALGLEVVDELRAAQGNNIFVAGGMVNGGASVAQCIAEGAQAAESIHRFLAGNREK